MAVVLDSDAVVGFLDRSDALHESADAAIRDVVSRQPLAVSVITYAEVLTGAKLGHHDEDLVTGFLTEVVSHIIPVDVEIADRAAELRAAERSLRMPDALIVATADLDPELELLLTGDQLVGKLKNLRCEVQLLPASA